MINIESPQKLLVACPCPRSFQTTNAEAKNTSIRLSRMIWSRIVTRYHSLFSTVPNEKIVHLIGTNLEDTPDLLEQSTVPLLMGFLSSR